MIAGQEGTLFFRLEGPLQSWGERARWTIRDTRLEPTKSGLVGLIGAAMGLGSSPVDDRQMAWMASQLRLGVRADRPGTVLRDYQTVVGGVLQAAGKIKINASTKEPETVESWRDYLSDACFLAALAGPLELLDDIEAALTRPVWPPYLGRRSCHPSAPLYPAVPGSPSRASRTNLVESLQTFPWLGRDPQPERVRAIVELAAGEYPPGLPVQRRQDVPLSFATRHFGFRQVYETQLTLAKKEE